tara:strand:+ start:5037 stop:5264 length:228 start_codon:yes stop_codon:yes gene_type:complete
MYLGTIKNVDYYHINTGTEAKKILREISEKPVEFVLEEHFSKIVDNEHSKAEYLRYYNSMGMWLVFIISVVLLQL